MILVAEDIGENMITDIANYLKQCFPDSFVEYTGMRHDFTLNPYTRIAKDKNDNEIFLTAKEFDLLYFLISRDAEHSGVNHLAARQHHLNIGPLMVIFGVPLGGRHKRFCMMT